VPGLAVLAAGIASVAVALAADAAHLLSAPEQDSVALRFALRGERPAGEVAVVAIDDVSFSDLRKPWPFPRSLHARAIDTLRRAGARTIVYDVQFTERTRAREDLALFDAVRRAPGTVLVTTETDGRGRHAILGGNESLAAARATGAAANLITEPSGVIQRFPYEVGGLATVGVAAARDGRGPSLSPSAFPASGAWIDFRGPPGTIPTVSFSDLVAGRADAALLRDKIVVVGVTAPTQQDVHPTPTSRERLMSGPEVQANAIWTALHGLPLRSAPGWARWLAILLAGLAPALATLRSRAVHAALLAPLLALAWIAGVQLAFQAGIVLPLTYPLLALLLSTMTAMTSALVHERGERRRTAQYNERLEREVSARTDQLRETQREIVSRLGRAVESRDADTGVHLDRMSTLSHRLALAAGMSPADAELLRHASLLHDVGKVGIPDRILGKRGPLDAAERTLMETHTAIGDEILAGSSSTLVRLAASIARSHHERWDGSGYPDGLRGEEIPLPARICALCDVFDALLSERPYKSAWPLDDALAEISAQRGRHFDPELTDAFLALVPSLEPELTATAPVARPELGLATVSSAPAGPPPRSRPGAGSGPAAGAGTSSSPPAAPSPPARG
jgi:response regulator RpfG family c-di-GMP phosphodiesterase